VTFSGKFSRLLVDLVTVEVFIDFLPVEFGLGVLVTLATFVAARLPTLLASSKRSNTEFEVHLLGHLSIFVVMYR